MSLKKGARCIDTVFTVTKESEWFLGSLRKLIQSSFAVFGFNSAKYDIDLMKNSLLPLLVKDKEIEPMVIKKANQFVSSKLGDIRMLDLLKSVGAAKSLDSFLKAYKSSETNGNFHETDSVI